MKSLVAGYGEVGYALYCILKDYYEIGYVDLTKKGERVEFEIPDKIEVLHICFQYSENFINEVKKYQEEYKPKYTIIHSTVPVGTSSQLNAIHSPIRGIHPYLEEGIKTFVKFVAGKGASEVSDYFRRAGIRVCLFDKAETSEALKLFDTEYYRDVIRFAHRVKKYCDKHDLSFHEVYTIANQTYNEGYTKLGMPEVVRPVLQPIMTEIGGHCLVPNSKLIKLSEDDESKDLSS